MAGREPFLINPHRLSRNRRQRRGGLPKRLLSRTMRTYGPGRGMSEAWSAFRRGVRRNTPSLGLLNPRRRNRRRRRLNPFGESVMIVGGNPRRRRKKGKEVISKMARVRRRKRVRRSRTRSRRRFSIKGLLGRLGVRRRRRRSRKALAMNPRRRRHYRRRVRLFNDNPRRRRRHHRRRAMFFDNPRRRRYRRRFRSNPRRARGVAGVPALSFARPMSMLMPAVIGTAGYLAAEKIPSMVNVTTALPRLGVKAAVGFGGGMLISKFLGRQNGAVFAIGVSINLLSDILNTYVFRSIGLSGFSAFPYQVRGYSGMGAYPQEFGDYPTGESYPM